MSNPTPLVLALLVCLTACGEPGDPVAPATGVLVLGSRDEALATSSSTASPTPGDRAGRGSEQRLRTLLDGFFRALNEGGDLAPHVHADFQMGPLHAPLEGEAVRYEQPAGEPGGIEVRVLERGAAGLPGNLPSYTADRAPETFERLKTTLGPGPVEWSLAVHSLEEVELRFHAGAASGARVQVNLWLRPLLEQGRLRALHGLRYEEVRAPAPLFAEVSARVFGEDPSYADEALAGIDGLLFRRDVLMGGDRYGWHGVAVGDVDGDGREDLYFPQPAGLPNRLFLHQPDGSVRDHTVKSRVGVLEESRAALLVNLDDDGDQDLVLAIGPGIATATNRGFGSFDDLVPVRGPGPGDVVGLAVGDADMDGDLDVYACRYSRGDYLDVPLSGDPQDAFGARNTLFLNEDGTFRDATDELGLTAGAPGFSRAALFVDLDQDGDQDLYVLNDFGPRILFQAGAGRVPSGGARFTRVEEPGIGGNAWALVDASGTGEPGLVGAVSSYAEARARAAAAEPDTWPRVLPGLGAGDRATATGFVSDLLFLDVDSRGRADVVRTFGLLSAPNRPTWDGTYLWDGAARSGTEALPRWRELRRAIAGGDALFSGGGPGLALGFPFGVDATHLAGLGDTSDGRALGALDWDDDGREDLVLRNRNAPRWQLFANRAPDAGNFLTVTLTGQGENRDAVGARVTVRSGDLVRSRSVTIGGSLGQSTKRLHFGVGDQERVERIEVVWPDGFEEVLTNLETNKRYDVRRGDRVLRWFPPQPVELEELPEVRFEPSSVGASRVPLAEKLPIGALTYAGFAGETLRIDGLAGSPVLFVLLELGAPTTPAVLAELQEKRNLVERGALRIVPLVLGATGETARRGVLNYGYMLGAGVADEAFLASLGVIIESVVGPVPTLPLPLSFLVDEGSQLTSLYFEAPDLDVLLADAESVWRMRTDNLAATRLMNGVRLMGRPRDFRALSERFSLMGREDLASFYGSLRR